MPGWTLGIIGALVIGGVLVLGYLVGADLLPTDRSDEVAFGDAAVGQCLDIRVEGVPPTRVASDDAVRDALVLGDARRVACSRPHSHEVAEVTGFDVGDAYPGDDFLIAIARPACQAGFRTYVGRDLEGSAIGMLIVAPDPIRWEDGDRRAVCLIRRNDGAYATGALRGTGT
jgi:hypothetical protein